MLWIIPDMMAAMTPMFDYVLWYILALAFICTVPILIRDIFRR